VEALKQIISDLDYDIHKSLECDEEDGTDRYPALAERFIKSHWEWAKSLELT
jgi:hypothetical protein